MSIQSDTPPVPPAPADHSQVEPSGTDGDAWQDDAWELDISIVESGPAADTLIRMTNDGCGATCESACSTTCP
ncbi:FxLD family lanthipeptide [Actinomadura sp. LOL_016]|uniref:FxLD family lanthipeptide n=1 Tax=unclassified Actinomadura TaxID=2626254 RepID=UPI003A81136F